MSEPRSVAPHFEEIEDVDVVFWHVDDLEGTLRAVVANGAEEYQPITERGHGFVTASVVDPFGNVLGIMSNPHYLEVLAGTI